MSQSAIPPRGAPLYTFDLSGSTKTLTFSVGNNNNNVAIFMMCQGAGAEAAALYYITAYGTNNVAYKNVVALNTASIVTVTATASGFTVQNTHNSHGVMVNLLVMETQAGVGTFTLST